MNRVIVKTLLLVLMNKLIHLK